MSVWENQFPRHVLAAVISQIIRCYTGCCEFENNNTVLTVIVLIQFRIHWVLYVGKSKNRTKFFFFFFAFSSYHDIYVIIIIPFSILQPPFGISIYQIIICYNNIDNTGRYICIYKIFLISTYSRYICQKFHIWLTSYVCSMFMVW